MRLWSIAFHYLDAKGLVALWRETLLAQEPLLAERIVARWIGTAARYAGA